MKQDGHPVDIGSPQVTGHFMRYVALLALLLTSNIARAEGQDSGWVVTNFFSPCARNCEITMLAGQSVTLTPATSIFLHAAPPSTWRWDDSYVLLGAFSRPLVSYSGYFSISPEIGLARRFGPASGFEAWVALFFRWTWFPWNQYIRTSVGVGVGPSLSNDTTIIRGSVVSNNGVHVINYFSPEITLGIPSEPRWDAVIRFQHRSPIWGLLPESAGFPQFWTFGMRFRF
jgi:hypothetical protein